MGVGGVRIGGLSVGGAGDTAGLAAPCWAIGRGGL